jgi:predicted amidophosphoribosyltransferase
VVAAWPLWTATVESAPLVAVVGAWKYRGVRGLARPLAALLEAPLDASGVGRHQARLVPVPLHPRRRRERGFDQCRQLARLAAGGAEPKPVADVLVRRRATAQQASFASADQRRRRNTADAFAARPPGPDEPRGIVLLDDLATTGATLAAAAGAARDAGWEIVGLVALGQAARLLDGQRG